MPIRVKKQVLKQLLRLSTISHNLWTSGDCESHRQWFAPLPNAWDESPSRSCGKQQYCVSPPWLTGFPPNKCGTTPEGVIGIGDFHLIEQLVVCRQAFTVSGGISTIATVGCPYEMSSKHPNMSMIELLWANNQQVSKLYDSLRKNLCRKNRFGWKTLKKLIISWSETYSNPIERPQAAFNLLATVHAHRTDESAAVLDTLTVSDQSRAGRTCLS